MKISFLMGLLTALLAVICGACLQFGLQPLAGGIAIAALVTVCTGLMCYLSGN